jgi:DNA-directed RNA polymerase subunit N (RpoN/RPB10)
MQSAFSVLEPGKCLNCGHHQSEHIYEQLVSQVESQNEKIKQLEDELAKKEEKERELVIWYFCTI